MFCIKILGCPNIGTNRLKASLFFHFFGFLSVRVIQERMEGEMFMGKDFRLIIENYDEENFAIDISFIKSIVTVKVPIKEQSYEVKRRIINELEKRNISIEKYKILPQKNNQNI